MKSMENLLKNIISFKKDLQKPIMDQLIVYNFKVINNYNYFLIIIKNPDEPIPISVPSKEGIKFKKDMEKLIENLNNNLPLIFERYFFFF